MMVQACINGARKPGFAPGFPVHGGSVAADIAACVRAGAAEVHFHPRGRDGVESIAAAVVDPLIRAVRARCPGTMLGVSSGEWIGGDPAAIPGHIASWKNPPDYASVNLYEERALDVMAALHAAGVGIEAGVYSVEDVERLYASPYARLAGRLLLEIEEQDVPRAADLAETLLDAVRRKGLFRPVLLHGLDASAWPLLRLAKAKGCSARIGFEDVDVLPDGSPAEDNAALVAAAVAIFREA